jgi:hypothetical protein
MASGSIIMAWREASIFVLLSCAWERLGKEREKREREKNKHGTVRILISKVPSNHSSTPAPSDKSCLSPVDTTQQFRDQPKWKRSLFSEIGFLLKDNFYDLVQYRAKGWKLGEKYSQLYLDNVRPTSLKLMFAYFVESQNWMSMGSEYQAQTKWALLAS